MKREEIYIPIEIEHLMTFLFGKRSTHGLVGFHSLGTWKKQVRRMVRAVHRATYVNIDSGDRFHKKWLLGLCDRADAEIRSARTKDDLHLLTIRFLAQMVFRLLGDMPNHWSNRTVNRLSDWRLDKNRKLIYAQTPVQKANLLFHLSNEKGFKGRIPQTLDMWLTIRRDFGGDFNQFIEWFRSKYQSVYHEVF